MHRHCLHSINYSPRPRGCASSTTSSTVMPREHRQEYHRATGTNAAATEGPNPRSNIGGQGVRWTWVGEPAPNRLHRLIVSGGPGIRRPAAGGWRVGGGRLTSTWTTPNGGGVPRASFSAADGHGRLRCAIQELAGFGGRGLCATDTKAAGVRCCRCRRRRPSLKVETKTDRDTTLRAPHTAFKTH